MDRDFFQTLQLVNTEIAEATEGDRKSLMDQHLPHLKSVEVELADAAIRILDLAGRYNWKYKKPDDFHIVGVNLLNSMNTLAGKHLILSLLVGAIAGLAIEGESYTSDDVQLMYSSFLASLIWIADSEKYNIELTIDLKLEYNAKRADHKRENRAKKHGKAF